MSLQDRKKLTAWLIVFMILLFLSSTNGIGAQITNVRKIYEPYFSQYPSLKNAVLIYQCVLFGAACIGFYTVWVLYQRLPGTLFVAQRGLVIFTTLRLASVWIFYQFAGGLGTGRASVRANMVSSVAVILTGAVWYLYLARSKRVREIFSA
ncbi:MAG: hypothetical protein JWM68_315 [Verrucomicrobiales bacterium]|nr:hypothetical protein [Verrucomicrobiales bacterium]